MIVVLDASAAVGVVLNKQNTEKIEKKLEEADYIIAPDIFVPEVVNAFWKYHQYEDLPLDKCEYFIDCAVNLVDDIIDSGTLYKEAFVLSCQVGHPIYDVLYLISARRHNSVLLSMDEKLKKIAKKQSIKIL